MSKRRNPAELPPGPDRWWFLGAQTLGLGLGILAAYVLPWPWGLLVIAATAASLPLTLVGMRLAARRRPTLSQQD